MNFEEKLKQIAQNAKLKNKLCTLGICGIKGPTGPTGPTGTGIRISGSYETEEDLYNSHPIGNNSDCYIINSNLYFWDEENNKWTNSGSIGPTARCNKSSIYIFKW